MVNFIIQEECIPSEWENSFFITCFRGKGDVMECDNYRGLNLLDLVMKVMKHILGNIIQTQIDIDSTQFGFMPSCSTIGAIGILHQMQEKHPS